MKEHDNFREQKAARYGCTAAYVVGDYAVEKYAAYVVEK